MGIVLHNPLDQNIYGGKNTNRSHWFQKHIGSSANTAWRHQTKWQLVTNGLASNQYSFSDSIFSGSPSTDFGLSVQNIPNLSKKIQKNTNCRLFWVCGYNTEDMQQNTTVWQLPTAFEKTLRPSCVSQKKWRHTTNEMEHDRIAFLSAPAAKCHRHGMHVME